MTRLGLIGGSGLDHLDGVEVVSREVVETDWGAPSAALTLARVGAHELVFLPRHGDRHQLPPHRINYRANIDALRRFGVDRVIAVAAVGAIDVSLPLSGIVVPHQIVDYTWGRAQTFFDDFTAGVRHVDFSDPFCPALRERLLAAARDESIPCVDGGVYAATQGPRLESAAEIDRLARDGCTLVGMTGMPEAALAREAGLCYAILAIVVNPAAGREPGEIRMTDIERRLASGVVSTMRIVQHVLRHEER